VKYGVRPGSYTHLTEFFGPVLGVMRFGQLDEAITLVNQTGYGLTSGLHSLDEREHQRWRDGIHAGNLYLNRGTTGAVVLRQPFGGWGKSSFGPGMKAGGPNYVTQFLKFEEATPGKPLPPAADKHLSVLRQALPAATISQIQVDASRLLRALDSYDYWWSEEFSRAHDHLRLLGQDNFRRYLPFNRVRVRVAPNDTGFELVARVCAARVTGARVIVSMFPGLPSDALKWLDEHTDSWAAAIEFVEETDEQLVKGLQVEAAHFVERLRYAAPDRVPAAIRQAAATAGVYLADEPVLTEGRVELLWYLREQSVCCDYHRYGNLGARVDEARRKPL
jgi:RHH-type transcriptional regulator, proline utilization regulon repressor / proline dehydrogenase / delta 1-pyrroline-5-carboxylate dehydrogenase